MSPVLYGLDCCSRKNMCRTDVNTIDTAIKTISISIWLIISVWLIVPVQRMHLKVITLRSSSTDQVMK